MNWANPAKSSCESVLYYDLKEAKTKEDKIRVIEDYKLRVARDLKIRSKMRSNK